MTNSHFATSLFAPLILFAAAGIAAAQQPGSNAEIGKRLFHDDGCYQCHGLVGQGGVAGPRLAPWASGADPSILYVRRPKGQMPPYTEKVLPDVDLMNIVAYLKSIPPPKKAADIPLLGGSSK